MSFRFFLLSLFAASLLAGPDDRLASTPPMGWNSWETFRTNINERLVRDTAGAMVSSGMRDAGYRYVVIDAGWKSRTRSEDGRLAADRAKFPSGMKALGDYIHSKGLKFGLYTDAGSEDCAGGGPGSLGHEALDAETFAEWGVDYVKEDWCHSEGLDAPAVYRKMARALHATGRSIVFSLCEWGDHQPWTWARGVGQLWRTTGDDAPCWDCGRDKMNWKGGYPRGWTLILDAQIPLATYAGPGHWNDPDMLEAGQPRMSDAASRAQFSLWAILAAPLMATNDLRTMPANLSSILLNREVIAVDQDPKGVEGTRVVQKDGLEVWARPLQDGSQAVVLFNRSENEAAISVSSTDLGFPGNARLRVRDLWAHREVGFFKNSYSGRVPPRAVNMLRISCARRPQ